MNWIICPVRNNLHLTKKAIKTFRAQDIRGGVQILVINNQSTDGTQEWLASQKGLHVASFDPPKSVAESWNMGLKFVFRPSFVLNPASSQYEENTNTHCLVVNNDVELRPDTYRHLVDDGGLFVTAVGTRDPEKIKPLEHDILNKVTDEFLRRNGAWGLPRSFALPDVNMKRPHPDFSCYLIRREAWEKVGPFDENFKIAFCEDGDYDLRLYKAGIRAYCIDLPFLHHGSMTIKNADPKEIKRIQIQADLNRKYFTRKWGFPMASGEYYRALDKGGPA